MRRALLIGFVLTVGLASDAFGATGHMSRPEPKVHHACTLTHCDRCPKGKWMCEGKCIPKRRACAIR